MLFLMLIPLLLLLVSGCSTTSGNGSGIGKLAPDFQLQDIENQSISLSNLRGNPVILNFWASWCGPCRDEMPLLQQTYEERESKGVLLLTVNLRETLSVAAQYMQDNGLSFPVLLDTDGSVALSYNVTAIPTTFFLDIDGIIQATKLGSFSSVAEIESYISRIQP
jgi:thiol-disulfide isomerase/thioredoxin